MTREGVSWSKLRDLFRKAVPQQSDVGDFCRHHRLSGRPTMRAWRGFPVPIENMLALCGALGVDPMTLRPPKRGTEPLGGKVLWSIFGAAVQGKRLVDGEPGRPLGVRMAGDAAGVSSATLSRVENGTPISTESFLRLCRWLQRHPHDFTARQPGACFTSNTDCNALENQGAGNV